MCQGGRGETENRGDTVSFQLRENRGQLGRRDKANPWKAVNIRGEVIALGSTKAEATANATAVLAEAYEWIGKEPLVSTLSDGSIFVAQQTGPKSYTLWRYGGTRKYPSSEGGTLGSTYKDLKAYMDFACVDYERAIAAPKREPLGSKFIGFD